MFTIFLFIIFSFLYNYIYLENDDCLLIHGTGYIGFWYNYNRLLNNNSYLKEDVIYCYSSGCLSILATLNNYTFDESLQISLDIQQQYKNRLLDYHQVRDKFILLLVNSITKNTYISNLKIIIFKNMNTCSFYTPRNKEEWYDYLIKTTNIPYLTSKSSSLKFLDGGFCLFFLPKCKNHLSVPINQLSFKNIFYADEMSEILINKLK